PAAPQGDDMKIDWKKLKAAIASDTATIRKLKAQGFHGGALDSEKLQATRHHALAAHLHRNIHLSGRFLCNPRWLSDTYGPCFVKEGMSMEEQEKFIAKVLPEFTLPEPAAEIPAQTA